jgi:hypothetical protein
MNKAFNFFAAFLFTMTATGQMLPYAIIPEQPIEYTAATVTARMIDGLGFRFYWATEGLSEQDYKFKPGDDARTIGETISHIYGLTNMIKYASLKKADDREVYAEITIFEMRNEVLKTLKKSADIFRNANSKEMVEFNIISKRGDKETVIPFWNAINGPLEDAVWHAGQIVTLRRMAGNPINSKVNFFMGKRNN